MLLKSSSHVNFVLFCCFFSTFEAITVEGEDALSSVISSITTPRENLVNNNTTAQQLRLNTGFWGEFGDPSPAEISWYGCGASVETCSGCRVDKVSAYGLKMLFCNSLDWNIQKWVTLKENDDGVWETAVLCNQGQYITGGEVRYQAPEAQVSGDDTALNGLKIQCKSPNSIESQWKNVTEGLLGDWQGPISILDETHNDGIDRFLVSVAIQYHESCGLLCDDTALNGISFVFDEFFRITAPPTTSPTIAGDVVGSQVVGVGMYGSWMSWSTQMYGFYACGAQLRFDTVEGTAANGLRLKLCNSADWGRSEWVMVYEGENGAWQPKVVCPYGSYINGAQVRYQQDMGMDEDDTALNGLRIQCQNPWNNDENEWKTVHEGLYGDWLSQVTRTKAYVTAVRVQYHLSCINVLGNLCDPTAVNGIEVFFENYVSRTATPTVSFAPFPCPPSFLDELSSQLFQVILAAYITNTIQGGGGGGGDDDAR